MSVRLLTIFLLISVVIISCDSPPTDQSQKEEQVDLGKRGPHTYISHKFRKERYAVPVNFKKMELEEYKIRVDKSDMDDYKKESFKSIVSNIFGRDLLSETIFASDTTDLMNFVNVTPLPNDWNLDQKSAQMIYDMINHQRKIDEGLGIKITKGEAEFIEDNKKKILNSTARYESEFANWYEGSYVLQTDRTLSIIRFCTTVKYDFLYFVEKTTTREVIF